LFVVGKLGGVVDGKQGRLRPEGWREQSRVEHLFCEEGAGRKVVKKLHRQVKFVSSVGKKKGGG